MMASLFKVLLKYSGFCIILTPRTRDKVKGFTLIEVIITVAIIGILASIAYPSYTEYIWRANRGEAQRELLRLANLEEQLFVDQRIYTADMTVLGMPDNPYLVPINAAPGRELYSISGVINGRTFVLTATAVGYQANDEAACLTLAVNESGLKTPIENCWE